MVPEIEAELQRVIPAGVGPIGDPLKLVFLLVQRTVALVDGKRVPEREAAHAAHGEGGQSGCVVIVEIQSGNTGVPGGRCSHAVGIDEHAIAEEPETKVGQPVRPQNVVDTIGQALVANAGGARERGAGEVRPAGQQSIGARRSQCELLEAESPEHVDLFGLITVHAHVKRVAVRDGRTGRDVIGSRARHTRDIRQRDQLQKILRLLR